MAGGVCGGRGEFGTLGGPFSGEGSAFPAVAIPVPASLEAQVAASTATYTESAEQDCLASAVYFEARGEHFRALVEAG